MTSTASVMRSPNKAKKQEITQPLHLRTIRSSGLTGLAAQQPAISKAWLSEIDFLPYIPADDSNKDFRDDYLVAMTEQFTKLLTLAYHQFWSQAVYDDTFRTCLDTYFASCPRSLDSVPESCRSLEAELQRKVFLTCLRLCTCKESAQDYMDPEMFGNTLYDNWLMDIPRLLDMCAVYGLANKELVGKMVENVFLHQPKYMHDLSEALPAFSDVFCAIRSRCGEAKEGKNVPAHAEALSLLAKLYDARSATRFYFFLHISSSVYETTMPVLYVLVKKHGDEPCFTTWRYAQSALLSAANTILSEAYTKPLQTASSASLARELSAVLDMLRQNPIFLRQFDRSFNGTDVIERIAETIEAAAPKDEANRNAGPESETKSAINLPPDAYGVRLALNETARAQLGSEINTIRDVLPDLGTGFIAACLQQMNHKVEEVLNCLLSDSLPTALQRIPRDLSLSDLERAVNARDAAQRTRAAQMFKRTPVRPDVLASRRNVYDGDEFDIFSRNDVDVSKMHVGKRDKLKDVGGDRYAREVTRWIAKGYEVKPVLDEYDDEYDDTYDHLDAGGLDMDSADELSVPNNRQLPWAKNMRRGDADDTFSEYEDDEAVSSHGLESTRTQQQGQRLATTSHATSRQTKGRGRGQGSAKEFAGKELDRLDSRDRHSKDGSDKQGVIYGSKAGSGGKQHKGRDVEHDRNAEKTGRKQNDDAGGMKEGKKQSGQRSDGKRDKSAAKASNGPKSSLMEIYEGSTTNYGIDDEKPTLHQRESLNKSSSQLPGRSGNNDDERNDLNDRGQLRSSGKPRDTREHGASKADRVNEEATQTSQRRPVMRYREERARFRQEMKTDTGSRPESPEAFDADGDSNGARPGHGIGRGNMAPPSEKELRDRAFNERHKGQRANHNRKDAAARKMDRGMN